VPNPAAPGNGAITPLFHAGGSQRAVPEQHCSARDMKVSILVSLAASILIATGSCAADLIVHNGTNFSIQLPSDFLRQPQRGSSDSFLFQADREGQAPIYFSLGRVVTTPTPLHKMGSVQVLDVVFQSGRFYLSDYADFVADADPDGWVYFRKRSSRNTLFATRFKVTHRQLLPSGNVEAAELVSIETERRIDPIHSPMASSGAAFIVDTGGRKYVFDVYPKADDKTLQALAAAISTFKETSEPGGAANRSQPVGPETNRTPSAAGSGG
jgi:hypothetical protein